MGKGDRRLVQGSKGSFALKQMHQLIVSANTITLIRREILLMARVRHPNLLLFIAAVLNHSGGPIIITELLDMSLRTAYMGGKLTSNPVRLSIMRDVAVGLNYLHLQKIPVIHRDISSGNVLLEELANNNWKGKISDFGSANVAQMAIIRILRSTEKLSNKIDVYSYGVLFVVESYCNISHDGQTNWIARELASHVCSSQ